MDEARAFGNLLAAASMSPSSSLLAVEWYKQNKHNAQFSLDSWLAHIAQHVDLFNQMNPPQHRMFRYQITRDW